MTPRNVTVLDWPDALAVLENNGLQPPSGGKVKNADVDEVDNGFLWDARRRLTDEIPVRSIKDMVDKLVALPADQCIKTLTMVGHGSRGNISTGDGSSWQANKHINSNQSEWENELSRLCSRFCRDAEVINIFLLGCNTGVCDEGARKLHKLANFFKDKCAGGTNRQKFRVHGTRRSIYPDDVVDALGKIDQGDLPDFTVSIQSDSTQEPQCLAPDHTVTEGLKKKEQQPPADPPTSQKKVVARPWPIPNPRRFVSMGFARLGMPVKEFFPIAPTEAFPVEKFLSLYDLDTAFEPAGLAADINGQAAFVAKNGEALYCPITLDHEGLIVDDGKERYLYVLRDPENRAMIRNLVANACDC